MYLDDGSIITKKVEITFIDYYNFFIVFLFFIVNVEIIIVRVLYDILGTL